MAMPIFSSTGISISTHDDDHFELNVVGGYQKQIKERMARSNSHVAIHSTAASLVIKGGFLDLMRGLPDLDCEVLKRPGYWKSNGTPWQAVDDGSWEYKNIKRLVADTWKDYGPGDRGKDAKNLTHNSIEVKSVHRLENYELWKGFVLGRDQLIEKNKRSHTETEVKTTTSLKESSSKVGRDVKREANEHYLFHGTRPEYINNIRENGLRPEKARSGGMLGKGVYTTESSTKADQYADDKDHRTEGPKHMLLLRVVLGNPYTTTSKNPVKYTSPPDKYDSVIDEYKGRRFREFVVYDWFMCYPEYFITYNRIG